MWQRYPSCRPKIPNKVLLAVLARILTTLSSCCNRYITYLIPFNQWKRRELNLISSCKPINNQYNQTKTILHIITCTLEELARAIVNRYQVKRIALVKIARASSKKDNPNKCPLLCWLYVHKWCKGDATAIVVLMESCRCNNWAMTKVLIMEILDMMATELVSWNFLKTNLSNSKMSSSKTIQPNRNMRTRSISNISKICREKWSNASKATHKSPNF